MTTRYVDPAAVGDNNGTDWTHAWTSPQSAFDTATAGDKVYMRGTYTYGAATSIDVDTNTGDLTDGMIKFIGCNAAGVVDGTRFVFDVNSEACDGLVSANDIDYIWLQNIEVKNAGVASDGLSSAAYSDGWVFNNCSFHDNGAHGVGSAGNLRYGVFFRCIAYDNVGAGFYTTVMPFMFCKSYGNTGHGFSYIATLLYGCFAYDNSDGISELGMLSKILNCVVDANTLKGIENGVNTLPRFSLVALTRITNQNGGGDIGLDGNDDPILTIGCYFQDNDGANIQADLNHYNISIDGTEATSNLEDQGDADEGYADLAGGNYNLASGATLRRVAVSLPTP